MCVRIAVLPVWLASVCPRVVQLGCRSKRAHAEDAVAAVRARNVLSAVFSYTAGGRGDEAADMALKELDGV